MPQDLPRTRRQQIGVVIACSAIRVITRLAATRAHNYQRHNPGDNEASHDDCQSDSTGRDPAVQSPRQ
jgi:hypothetical protein